MAIMSDEERRAKRREWVVVERTNYLDGVIETREGRPLRPRLKLKIDYRAVPAKGSAMPFSTMEDAKRWIREKDVGGNPNGFLQEIAGRKFRNRR